MADHVTRTVPREPQGRLVAAGHIAGRRFTRISFDAGMPSDDYLRARHREDAYDVPDGQRSTCAEHDDWRDHCAHLHQAAA